MPSVFEPVVGGLLSALYGAALVVCPADFRSSFKAEMLDCYRRRLADLLRERGLMATLRYGWKSHIDLFRVAWEIHQDAPALSAGNRKKEKFMQDFWRDFQFALRILVRKPLLSLVIVLTLALGIGANSVIFSGVNSILLYRPPAVDAEQLAYLFFHNRRQGNYSHSFSYPNFKDLLEQSTVFSGILLNQMQRAALTIEGSTEIHFGEKVSENYFQVLGREAALGRVFLPEDGTQSEPVVVIGHSLWRDRFGSDPAVVGKAILMDSQGFTILGVMAPDFPGTEYGLSMDFWLPISQATQSIYSGIQAEMNCRSCGNYDPAVARLRPGLSWEEAQAELDVISRRLEQEYSTELKDQEVHLSPAIGPAIDPNGAKMAGLSAWLAMALVGMVLLIACANVASLMIARADSRRREMGIRVALGAGRWRLVRQMLTESMILSGVGGALALLVAFVGSNPLWGSFMPHLEYTLSIDFAPDGRVLGFTVALSLLTGLFFGLMPARQAARTDLIPSLKDGEGKVQRRTGLASLRSALVVGQVALSFVLLTVSGLFMAGLVNARNLHPGFHTENVLFVSIDIQKPGRTPQAGRALYGQIRQRVEALPGVASADWTQNLPLDDKGQSNEVWADGVQRKEDTIGAERYSVGPRFFETMGIPLLQGRFFQDSDRPNAPRVAIVSQSLANRLWPDENPLGKRFRLSSNPSSRWREVVGVVPDLKHRDLWEPESPSIYTANTQEYFTSLTLSLRSADGDPGALVSPVRQAVREVDPQIPVFDIKTISQHLTRALWLPRMGADLALLFGVLALVLATVGLHGVVSYSVSRRTREIGIRMAVGAGGRDILRLVARHSLILLAVGSIIGLGAALAVSQLLEGLLFGIDSLPWPLLALVAVLLLAVTGLASFVPARRAVRINPTQALRFE